MDLWTILQTLARRWYLSVPLVVASVFGAFALANSLANSYTAEATILIAAPNERLVEVPVDPTDPTNRETRTEVIDVNPITEGVGNVGLAASTLQLTLISDGIVDQMFELGLSWDSYEVTTVTGNGSILWIIADGETPEQAIATVEYLIGRVDSDLEALQDRLGAPETARIDDEVLTRPEEAFLTSSGKPRIILGVTLAGLVLTVLIVTAVDSVLRPTPRAETQPAAAGNRRPMEPVRSDGQDRAEQAPNRNGSRRSGRAKPVKTGKSKSTKAAKADDDDAEESGRWQRAGSQ